MTSVTVIFHLGNGKQASTVVAMEDEEAEAEALRIAELLQGSKPHWLFYENLIVFTGAVSAVEVV